jgi:hypothetical protein
MFGWTKAELFGKKMHDATLYKHPDGTPFPAEDCPNLQIVQRGIELRSRTMCASGKTAVSFLSFLAHHR